MTDRDRMIEVMLGKDNKSFVSRMEIEIYADRLIEAGFGMVRKWDAESLHKEMVKNGYCGPSTRESAARIVRIINGGNE